MGWNWMLDGGDLVMSFEEKKRTDHMALEFSIFHLKSRDFLLYRPIEERKPPTLEASLCMWFRLSCRIQ